MGEKLNILKIQYISGIIDASFLSDLRQCQTPYKTMIDFMSLVIPEITFRSKSFVTLSFLPQSAPNRDPRLLQRVPSGISVRCLYEDLVQMLLIQVLQM